MSSAIHVDNKKKDILVLGKGPTQGLESTLTAEKCTQLTLLWQKKRFVWAYTIMQIVIYLLMAQKCIKLKQKILQL